MTSRCVKDVFPSSKCTLWPYACLQKRFWSKSNLALSMRLEILMPWWESVRRTISWEKYSGFLLLLGNPMFDSTEENGSFARLYEACVQAGYLCGCWAGVMINEELLKFGCLVCMKSTLVLCCIINYKWKNSTYHRLTFCWVQIRLILIIEENECCPHDATDLC